MLRTNRGLAKFFFLSLITFGIYGIVCMSHVASDLNKVATPRDGKHTMQYWIVCIFLTVITLGIAFIVWNHRICNRIGNELQARNIPYHIGAGTFWGWGIFGYLILVGPFIYLHKFFKAMNYLNADYNNSLSQDTAGESEQIATESSASYLPITNNITGFLNYTRIAWISLLVLLLPILGLNIMCLAIYRPIDIPPVFEIIITVLNIIYPILMLVWFVMLKKSCGSIKEFRTSSILGIISFAILIVSTLLRALFWMSITGGGYGPNLFIFNTMPAILNFVVVVLLVVTFFLVAKALPEGPARSTARLWAILLVVEFCISIFIGYFLLGILLETSGYYLDDVSIHNTYATISRITSIVFVVIEYGVMSIFLSRLVSTMEQHGNARLQQ